MATRLEVLVVDDEPAVREVLSLRISEWGHVVRSFGDPAEALRDIDARPPHVVLCDALLPKSSGVALLYRVRERSAELPLVMIAEHGDVLSAIMAMKAGATDVLTKPIDYESVRALLDGVERKVRETTARNTVDAQLDALCTDLGLIGVSRAMRDLVATIQLVASSDASAIVTGESGTGKEVVARSIHTLSARHDKPFIAVNAAAIPEGLVESELFGHEQGAFTGASRSRPGCFELAHGGTLFLDEIAEMPMSVQPKLLRVLETGRARRVGGTREGRFDVRVIAATNRAIADAIRDARLREDLFYRLGVFEIAIPPLRERAEDIPVLAQYFVREMNRKHRLRIDGIDAEALQLLQTHAWPGNVRQLRNVIERAVITARSGSIGRRNLPPYLQTARAGLGPTVLLPAGTTMADAERRLIVHTLERVDGNKAEAARQLGLDVKTIRNKLRAYGIGRV